MIPLIKPDCPIRLDGEPYRFLRWTTRKTLSIAHARTFVPREVTIQELEEAVENGAFEIDWSQDNGETHRAEREDFVQQPPWVKQKALHRERYLRALLREGIPLTRRKAEPFIRRIALDMNDPHPPSVPTLCRWMRRYRGCGDNVRGLLDHNSFRRSPRRLPPQVHEVIEEMIDTSYMTRQRHSIAKVHEAICARIEELNAARPSVHMPLLQKPSKPTVARTISGRNRYEVTAAREGTRVAKERYRAIGSGLTTTRPLELVLIDHQEMDILIVAEDSGDIIGRPWITVAIDYHTRMIVGLDIGIEEPNTVVLGRCLKMVLKPKGWVKKQYPSIETDWPAWGLPEYMLSDNGSEFHAATMRDHCANLGIGQDYGPPYTPTYRGVLERFFGTLNTSLVHGLPGTTFSNPKDRGDYDSAAQACMTLEQLRERVVQFILDTYHRRQHTALKRTPYEHWMECVKVYPIAIPERPADVEALTYVSQFRNLARSFMVNNITYSGGGLQTLIQRLPLGQEVKVYIDADDVSRAWVVDPQNGQRLEVPAVAGPELKDRTLSEHKAVTKRAKAEVQPEDERLRHKRSLELLNLSRQAEKEPKRRRSKKVVGREEGRMRGLSKPMLPHEPGAAGPSPQTQRPAGADDDDDDFDPSTMSIV